MKKIGVAVRFTLARFRKLTKIIAAFVCVALVSGMFSLVPTAFAKTSYKTLAYDKQLVRKEDFANGKLKNIKLEEKNGGIEMGSANGELGEYITPVVQAPFGATHIGLHWKQELVNDASITTYLRTSSDGVNFGDWVKTTAEADEGRDDMPAMETFAALVGAGKNSYAQAKIEFVPEKGISQKLKTLTFTFINSGEESKQITKKLSLALTSIAAGAGTLKTPPNGQSINVISREDWGADESYRLNTDGSESWPRSYHGTRKLIIHHTAVLDSNGVTDLETNKANVRAIYYYHAVTQGWGDIGYNALVDAAGNIYEGRYGTHGTIPTRSVPSADQIMALDVEAGHASSYNSGSFGVSAMGDFTSFDIPPAQLASMEDVLVYVADSRGIDAMGSSDFLRYDGTWHSNLNNITGHRDVNATACPGDMLYPHLGEIKTAVAGRMLPGLSNFSATVNSLPISGTNIGLEIMNFGWTAFSGAAQYQYALERVYGTTGVASDSESWETAWLNSENTNMQTTANTNVQIDASTLQLNSNYVFYVRALDANELPISNVSHVNFKKDGSVLDTTAPAAKITNPADGATVSGLVTVSANASDNIGVKLFELYIDGKKAVTSTTGSISYNWNIKKVTVGTHIITAKVYDAAGNTGTASISVTKLASTPHPPKK